MSVIKFKANPNDPNSEWITVPVIAGPKGERGEKGEKGDRGNDGGLTDEQQTNLNKVPELAEKIENHTHDELNQIGINKASIESIENSLETLTTNVSTNTENINTLQEELENHTHSQFNQIESNKNEISKIKDSLNSGEIGGSFKTDWGSIPPSGGLDESIKVSLKKGIQNRLEQYAGINGEVIVNTDTKTLHVMDGSTKGGTRLATYNEVAELNIPDANDYYTKEEIDETNAEISQRLNDMELSGFKTEWGSIGNENSISVSVKKGSNLNLNEFKGINGELIVNTDTYAVHVMDGESFGGTELARKSDLDSRIIEINENFNNYSTDEELQEFLDLKVDAEEGKGLSTNDFDDGYKYKLDNLSNYELPVASSEVVGGIKVGSGLTVTEDGTLNVIGGSDGQGGTVDLSNYYTKKEVDDSLRNKVNTEEGKGLSTNDFTNTYKNKLNNLNNYELPTASSSVIGGVKIGGGLTVGSDGTLSVIGGSNEDGSIVDLSNYYTKEEIDNLLENLNPDGTGSANLEELNNKVNTLTELVEGHLLDGPVEEVELIDKKRDNINMLSILMGLKEEINNIKKSLKL